MKVIIGILINKEFGSDFHYFFEENVNKLSLFSEDKFLFFFSGRVALFNLLKFGIEKYQWKKVGFPSYYCHEVVEFCNKLPIEVIYYQFNPSSDSESIVWEDKENNVFVNIDFFGIKKLDTLFIKKSIIIDDLTHNLLSFNESKADYCFASLRKQIPIAVGGLCLSKNNDFSLQINETDLANKTAVQKLSAMYLKAMYLRGSFQEKNFFRELYINAEENFKLIETNSKLPKIIHSQLFSLNPENLIQATRKNCQILKSKIQTSAKVKILQTEAETEMGLVLQFETNYLRDETRKHLIKNLIYPAVLWPKQFLQTDIELERTIIFIHCDFRYIEQDIEFIALTLNNFIKNV
jgi:hypothetical protein